MNKEKVWFVTGIDTNIGKTYATAYLAKGLAAENHSVITQKMIQTGCDKVSEDIENMKFNTAIAALMTLLNDFGKAGEITKDDLVAFIKLLVKLCAESLGEGFLFILLVLVYS